MQRHQYTVIEISESNHGLIIKAEGGIYIKLSSGTITELSKIYHNFGKDICACCKTNHVKKDGENVVYCKQCSEYILNKQKNYFS